MMPTPDSHMIYILFLDFHNHLIPDWKVLVHFTLASGLPQTSLLTIRTWIFQEIQMMLGPPIPQDLQNILGA